MIKKTKIVCVVLVLTFLFSIPASAIQINVGVAGVGDYPNCSYGALPAKVYGNKMTAQLLYYMSQIPHQVSIKKELYNASVTRSALLAENNNYYTLFVFSGHGIPLNESHNAWHVDGGTNHAKLTNDHRNTAVNFSTAEARFKHNYVIAYTCNFLTNGGSTTKAENILKTMNGNRLICGFASQMYVHSDEATEFARIAVFQSVRSAYINAAWTYQVYRKTGETSIIRVVGHQDSFYERLYDGKGQQIPYSSSSQKSKYGILQTEYATGR